MQRELNFVNPQDVLYIEDHPTNVHLMQALFRRCPHLNLVVAEDGRRARSLASTIRPSLLLVDLRLPDCHGSELLEELRRAEGYADIPAVAVTAEPAFRIEGTSFCEVWPKPLDLAFVLDRLDQFATPDGPLFASRERLSSPALHHE